MRLNKYIERKNAITYISVANITYGELLRKVTGFGFKKQIYVYQNTVATFYKPESEFKKAYKYFASISYANLKKWHKEGFRQLIKEQKLKLREI